MNKKGATLTNWVFTIAMILVLLVVIQSQILTPMNNMYNNTLSTGLNTSGLDDLQGLKETTDSEIQGAEVTQTSDGLTLKSSWTVGKAVYNTIVTFIRGDFIRTLFVDILDFPEVIANILVVLIWLSLIMIIIYIFMKVVP